MSGVVMTVLVAFAVAETFGAGVMRIPQMFGHGQSAARAHVLQRRINGQDAAVALMGSGDVESGLGDRNARFRPADELGGLMGRIRQHQRHGIGQAHIFRRTNDDSPSDEARVFSGFNHFGQPIEGRVRITSSHRFDERRNCIKMAVLIRVINNRLALNALFSDGQRNSDHPIVAGRSGQSGDFQSIQRFASISVGNPGQVPQGRFVGKDYQMSKPALLIPQGALQQTIEFFFTQRTQLKYLRAGDQRGIDKEKWIVSRGANQPDGAALHIRQQNILLSFVETVDFIDEKNRGLAGVLQTVGRGGKDAPHVRHIGFHATQPLKFAGSLTRDELGEGCLARAGRTVEDERLNAVRLDGAAQ